MVSVYHPARVKGAEIFVDPISAYGCLDLFISIPVHVLTYPTDSYSGVRIVIECTSIWL